MYKAKAVTAAAHGEHALALARNIRQPDLIVQSLGALASIKMHLGEWRENEQLITEAYTLYTASRNRAMEVDCLCLLANTHLHCGLPQTGIMQARNALTISQEIENPWGEVTAIHELTSGLLDIGAYTEALEAALRAVACARALRERTSLANSLLLRSLIQLGSVYRAIQAFHAACEVDMEALKLNEAIFSRPYTPVVSTVLCADYVLNREWSEAQRYAQQASALEGYEVIPYVVMPRWLITEALLHSGNIARAEEYVGKFGECHKDGRRNRIEYLQAYASLAQGEGQTGRALSHLEEARMLAEEIGLPGELWHIQAALADLYQSRGELVLAVQCRSQAATVVRKLTRMIEDEALQTGFLAAPQVRRVLDDSIPIAGTSV